MKGISLSLAAVEAHQKHHGFLPQVVVEDKPVIPKDKLRGSRQPNKTESAFGDILEARRRAGEFLSVTFEAVKLRIAGNCYYTPDWMAVCAQSNSPIFFEVKGAHVWDDSKVKFRAVQERYCDWADFEMWQKKAGEWRQIL